MSTEVTPTRGTWCEIHADVIRENLRLLRQKTTAKVLLVVKANGYGHGLVHMGRIAQSAGVEMLGVATVNEALRLQRGGIKLPVLLIASYTLEEVDTLVARGIHFVAWRQDQFAAAQRAAKRHMTTPKLHLEIDTGMARSGVQPSLLTPLLNELSAEARQYIVGVMTHFYSVAPIEDLSVTRQLLDTFHSCLDVVSSFGIMHTTVHAANSAALQRLPESHFDMVRVGITAYGLAASKYVPLPEGITPALSWKARITDTHVLEIGQGISYEWQYVATTRQRIATLPVGYADGLHPYFKGEVLFRGERVPVVGRVCMDQLVIRIPDHLTCSIGDEVVLVGRQGDQVIHARDVAHACGTNAHDLLSGINERVPRIVT